jgi:hypothetical protein
VSTGASAGWYPDPQGRPGWQRWFDGTAWTEHTQPVPGPPSPPVWTAAGPAGPKPSHVGRNILIGVAIVVALAIVGLVVAVIIGVAVGVDHDIRQVRTPGSGTAAHPSSADARLAHCTITAGGVAEAQIVITNHSGGPSDYTVTVGFLRLSGASVGTGSVTANDVFPNSVVDETVTGPSMSGPLICHLVSVNRFAAS